MAQYKVKRKYVKKPVIHINKTFEYKVLDNKNEELCFGSLVFKIFSDLEKFAKFIYKMYNGENIKVNIINNNVADIRKSL